MKLTPFVVAFTAVAVATLGACSMLSQPTTTPTPQLVTNVNPLHPGSGVVQNVMPAPVMAGATTSSAEPVRRIELKMSDGRMQYLDTATIDLKRGDRVQIGEDGVIRRG
jgi:hypothetical protein